MKTAIQYIRRSDPDMEGFYHAEVPVLFGIDTIGKLEDCPFPIKTDSFEVLAWGTTAHPADEDPKYGHTHRFAVVRYRKSCGHLVEERITFSEGVETFSHCGTTFTGESYSVNDWQGRIERFRQYPCEVCGLVKHQLWHWTMGHGVCNRNKAIKDCLFLLNANYANWREFTTEDAVVEAFKAKRGSDHRKRK